MYLNGCDIHFPPQRPRRPRPPRKDGLDPRMLRTAFAIIVGGIAVIFDSTIVSVAIKDLGRELDATVSEIQWVSTGYLLAMFVAIPATGWLQSRLGGRWSGSTRWPSSASAPCCAPAPGTPRA